MNSPIKILFVLATGWLTLTSASAQDRIHYTGTELSNPTYHDGQLSPVVGVHNIQLVRANREHPDASNGGGWITNRCWPIGMGNSIINIWQIRRMSIFRLPRLF